MRSDKFGQHDRHKGVGALAVQRINVRQHWARERAIRRIYNDKARIGKIFRYLFANLFRAFGIDRNMEQQRVGINVAFGLFKE